MKNARGMQQRRLFLQREVCISTPVINKLGCLIICFMFSVCHEYLIAYHLCCLLFTFLKMRKESDHDNDPEPEQEAGDKNVPNAGEAQTTNQDSRNAEVCVMNHSVVDGIRS